jgi:hypothetical protein
LIHRFQFLSLLSGERFDAIITTICTRKLPLDRISAGDSLSNRFEFECENDLALPADQSHGAGRFNTEGDFKKDMTVNVI